MYLTRRAVYQVDSQCERVLDCQFTQRPLVAPVQVPYVPDFWHSARSKPDAPFEPELPKVHVGGGPMYNLEKLQDDTPTVHARDPPLSNDFGFWADFWESLGLPRSFSVRRSLSEAGNLAAQASNDGPKPQSRPLTYGERKGFYISVGASWLVEALVNRPMVVAEEHGTH